MEITSSDSGVYACIGKRSISAARRPQYGGYCDEKCDGNFLAGSSHAETQLMVKFRSKEQISSEEYLRLGNSVHLQRNANLDSAPASSGESLYTDRAGEQSARVLLLNNVSRVLVLKSSRIPHAVHEKKETLPCRSKQSLHIYLLIPSRRAAVIINTTVPKNDEKSALLNSDLILCSSLRQPLRQRGHQPRARVSQQADAEAASEEAEDQPGAVGRHDDEGTRRHLLRPGTPYAQLGRPRIVHLRQSNRVACYFNIRLTRAHMHEPCRN